MEEAERKKLKKVCGYFEFLGNFLCNLMLLLVEV